MEDCERFVVFVQKEKRGRRADKGRADTLKECAQ